MQTGWRHGVLAALVVAVAACGSDEETTAPLRNGIIGNWEATQVEYRSRINASVRIDLIEASATATLTIGADNSYVLTITRLGGSPEITTATWMLDGGVLSVTPTGMPWSWQFSVQLSGDSLRLGGADAEYDFDNDGQADPAQLTLVLTRQAGH
jgi:hypothetical protein